MQIKTPFFLIFLIALLAGCGQLNEQQNNNVDFEHGVGNSLQEHDSHISAYDFPKEELSEYEIEALKLTIEDEYKAKDTYKKIMDKFGEIRPFSNIINSEQVHIDSLKELYEKYELDVPVDQKLGTGDFETVSDACAAGVQAEIDNAALYDEMLPQIDNEDVKAVFISLRDASITKHKLAFERCS